MIASVLSRLTRVLIRLISTVAQPNRRVRELLRLDAFLRVELDRAAIAYEGGDHPKHRLTRYHDYFVERIAPGERVLDVGCGNASLAHDLAERAEAEVVGIDFDERMLERARAVRAHPRLELVHADALEYRPDRAFDVVVLSNVLEHIAPRVELLRELREHTGAARFLIRVPVLERDWAVPLRRELGLAYFGDATHETEYVSGQLEAELDEAGLRLVELDHRWSELWAMAAPL
jgi:SAM-dependent methyltransferase